MAGGWRFRGRFGGARRHRARAGRCAARQAPPACLHPRPRRAADRPGGAFAGTPRPPRPTAPRPRPPRPGWCRS
ncbi:MAG TPA: hypothetical protein DCP91_00900 [Eggerthellaceae bacterium]|nr:hypothetical protein [Eggerthellaceae bacterium]